MSTTALDAILIAAKRYRVGVSVNATGITLLFWPRPLHAHSAEALLVKLREREAKELN